MKYFTNELWDKINSESLIEKRKAYEKWEKNRLKYWNEFEKIKGRISKKAFEILKTSFHDFRLYDFQIIHAPFGELNLLEVNLIITDGEDTWQIKYKDIKKIKLDFEQGTSAVGKRRGFDNWGYDELLSFDRNLLSHEILFASGASILIIFKNNRLSITKMKDVKISYDKNDSK